MEPNHQEAYDLSSGEHVSWLVFIPKAMMVFLEREGERGKEKEGRRGLQSRICQCRKGRV